MYFTSNLSTVSNFIFKYFINLEFVSAWCAVKFFFFSHGQQIDPIWFTEFFFAPLIWNDTFILYEIRIYMGLLLLSFVLFHWFICLFLQLNHTAGMYIKLHNVIAHCLLSSKNPTSFLYFFFFQNALGNSKVPSEI